MPYYSKEKCIYKKDTNKKVGCTKGPIKKYMAALHANVKESLSSQNVSSNLEFKNLRFPSRNTAIATYHYRSEKDSIDIMLTFALGRTLEEVDYSYATIKDNNDIHSKSIKFEDPQSDEIKQFIEAKHLNLTSDDIEMAGQDAYSKIETTLEAPQETGESYEEGLKFEALFHSILNEEKL
jgi:hypothetical protein